jgi:biotin operon repressor
VPIPAPIAENNKLLSSVSVLPWPLHDACACRPEMPPADLKALAEDIAEHGLRDKIVLTTDGQLLDGRNRALACFMVGVELTTETYTGDDPWGFVLSRNKHRRHMSQDHIAMVVAEMVKMKPLGANRYEGGPNGLPSITKAAHEAGITETALKSAKAVLRHGTPEDVQAVKSGAVPLYKKADDVRKRRRALAPPAAPPKPKPVKAQPAVDPIEALACQIIEALSDGKWRSLPQVASTFKVAESAVREALKRLKDEGEDCVEQRKNGNGFEYRIVGSEEAHLRRVVAARDVEIASLKNRIAEKDAEIARLTELLTAAPPRPTPSSKKANLSKH